MLEYAYLSQAIRDSERRACPCGLADFDFVTAKLWPKSRVISPKEHALV